MSTIHDTLLNLHGILEELESESNGTLTISRVDHQWTISVNFDNTSWSQGSIALSSTDEDFDQALDDVLFLLQDDRLD